MSQCYLLLGTNMSDRMRNLLQANELIAEQIGEISKQSSIYKTAAWGKEDQDYFLNQVIEVDTQLTPEEVLIGCLSIEKKIGRIRYEKWGERLIDIDILYYDQLVLKGDALTVPHAEIQNRKFTLVPLAEIAPEAIHPIMNCSNQQLLDSCTDPLEVEKIGSKSLKRE